MGAVAPALVGVAFAGFAAALLRLTGMERDRAAAPVILIAVAAFWPVFAVEEGGAAEIALHGAVASSFLALALVAHRRGFRPRRSWADRPRRLFDARRGAPLGRPWAALVGAVLLGLRRRAGRVPPRPPSRSLRDLLAALMPPPHGGVVSSGTSAQGSRP